jgi:hypothetical protein
MAAAASCFFVISKSARAATEEAVLLSHPAILFVYFFTS